MVMEIKKPESYILPKSSKSYIKKGQIKGCGSLSQLTVAFRTDIYAFFYSLLDKKSDISKLPHIKMPEFIATKKAKQTKQDK